MNHIFTSRWTLFTGVVLTVFALPGYAQVEFGDNRSEWANDGECDDPRFVGDGMASVLLDEDLYADANDCRNLFDAGRIRLRTSTGVEFGDDRSQWSNDGECDDPRFVGDGMADVLLDDDLYADATDCRSLFETGRITLRDAQGSRTVSADGIDFGDDSGEWTHDGECDDPRFVGDGMASVLLDKDRLADATDCRNLFESGRIRLRTGDADPDSGAPAAELTVGSDERGQLEPGDGALESGEYRDYYTFDGVEGDIAVVDLRSDDFDPYLIVRTPSGEQYDNDDYEGDTSRSFLTFPIVESGTYRVGVTSYEADETGDYVLRVETEADDGQDIGTTEREGALTAGDSTLESGEYMDSYEFIGRPGNQVTVDLRSEDFDTYVMLIDPSGEQEENDDAEDTSHSRIEMTLAETGVYEVIVTSYEPGELGDYELVIDQVDGAGIQPNREPGTLTVGRSTSGRLQYTDLEANTGEYRDLYAFDGTAGESIRVEMSSDDFDTFLALTTPGGDVIDNDDFEGSTARSVVELELPETGRYRVAATSYGAGETGAYRLLVDARSGPATVLERTGERGQGRTYGIFAGISDYPGTDNDLEFTADDAIRVRDALIRGGGMRAEDAVTLTDADATAENLRDAIERLAAQTGPQDTFVLFYSGHGDRIERAAGPEVFDPDSLDETLELYDDAISDDELRVMLDSVRAGTTLLLLDSCFSGGFAKDVISVPGRMGLFSSEEDLTSQVAFKFRAGGYLAYFLDEAIGDRLADEDQNGNVTALELSEYVHARYREDIKPASGGSVARSGGAQSSYQRLVVDRGSIGPYDVLFP
jgi:hypothetical protein